MFLTASNLTHYLVVRGLVQLPQVATGEIMVIEVGRQNRNFKVIDSVSHGLFVKQIKEIDFFAQSRIRREAHCYRLARDYDDWGGIMPRLVDYDDARHCIIIELVSQGENLRDYHTRLRKFSPAIGLLLGLTIARYHQSLNQQSLTKGDFTPFMQRLPWIYTYHIKSRFRPGCISKGAVQIGSVIRSIPMLQQHLARLRQEWRYDSLIHGDMKWDNCVVSPSSDGSLDLKIVDWELVDFGDASWDVGGVFQSYLSHWIALTYGNADLSVESLIENTTAKMPEMFSALRAFWDAYIKSRDINEVDAQAYLLRCLEHAAVRMVQTAFESLHNAATMTNQASALLQLSQNILDNPSLAARELFGFVEVPDHV